MSVRRTWTNTNSYRESEALSDIFTWTILRHGCFMFKYSMTESSQWNLLLLDKHELASWNLAKNYLKSIEYFSHNQNLLCQLSSHGPFTDIDYLTLVLLSSLWNIYHGTAAYFFGSTHITGLTGACLHWYAVSYHAIRYDTWSYFNVRSKADMSLPGPILSVFPANCYTLFTLLFTLLY